VGFGDTDRQAVTASTRPDGYAAINDASSSGGGGIHAGTFRLGIMKKIASPALAVFLNFTITLAVFPSITAKIRSTSGNSSRITNDLFIPMAVFINFNLFDLFGRSIAGWKTMFGPKTLVTPVLWRLIFIPALLLCEVEGSSLPHLLRNDAFPYLIIAFLALTNGFLGSLCMMYGPQLVSPEESEFAGVFMAFSLSAGIAMGCWLSFAVLAIAVGGNPFS
jgi:equilibrative nucleoside transporter 1/2/3